MQFYYGIANAADANERWTSTLLHDSYLVACGDGVPANARSCGNRLVSWSGTAVRPPSSGSTPPAPASLVAGVNGLMGIDSERAIAFRNKGRDFGVHDISN